MAPKRPLPEQFANPARKCRRTVSYEEKASDDESTIHKDPDSDSDSDSDFDQDSASDVDGGDSVSDAENESDPEYKDNKSPTKRIVRASPTHRGGASPKRSLRALNKAEPPVKRWFRATSSLPDVIRMDSATSINAQRQVTPSKSRSRSASTPAEDKPWVSLSVWQERPDRRNPENKPWVPLYPAPPVSTGNQFQMARGERYEADSDDDDSDDDDYDDYYQPEAKDKALSSIYPREPIFSIMDPLHPDNPANFRSCMEALPNDDSDDDESRKTKRRTKTVRDEDNESDTSEYTGEDEEDDD